MTFEKTALLEKSTFQPPLNVCEFRLGPLYTHPDGGISPEKRLLPDFNLAADIEVRASLVLYAVFIIIEENRKLSAFLFNLTLQ
jgi:hypothetical protein